MPNVEAEVTVEVTVHVEGHERNAIVFSTATLLPTQQMSTRQTVDDNDVRAEKAVAAALNEAFREELARLLKQTAGQTHSKS